MVSQVSLRLVANVIRARIEHGKAGNGEETMTLEQRGLYRNDIVRHFKGGLYIIDRLATHSETGESFVVYYSSAHPHKAYVRPEGMFCSEVDRVKYPDAGQRYRFEKVQQ